MEMFSSYVLIRSSFIKMVNISMGTSWSRSMRLKESDYGIMGGRGSFLIGVSRFLLRFLSFFCSVGGRNMLLTIVALLLLLNVQVSVVLIISHQHDRRFERYMRVLIVAEKEGEDQ